MDKLGDRVFSQNADSNKSLRSIEAPMQPTKAFDISTIIGNQTNLMDIKINA